MSTQIRPTVSNVTVSFGLISFPVDLLPAMKSKQSKARTASTTLACPTCQAGGELVPIAQQFTCSEHAGHGPFAKGDTVTALVVDGELRLPDPKAISEATATEGVRDLIELTVHPAVEVEAHTFPSGNIYRLRPRDNEAHYALVRELARDTDVAFLAEVTNKGATLLYRLVERDGVLVLTELVRPDRIHPAEPLADMAFDAKLLSVGVSLVESLMESFDPAVWVDWRKARLEALAASLGAQDPAPAPADASAAETASNLLELLRRSVDAAA